MALLQGTDDLVGHQIIFAKFLVIVLELDFPQNLVSLGVAENGIVATGNITRTSVYAFVGVNYEGHPTHDALYLTNFAASNFVVGAHRVASDENFHRPGVVGVAETKAVFTVGVFKAGTLAVGDDIPHLGIDAFLHFFVGDAGDFYGEIWLDGNMAFLIFRTLFDLDVGAVTGKI